jgi:glycosyltransferase involved in cell wall biosynthesis
VSRIVMVRQGLSVPGDPRVWREATALAAAGHSLTVVASRDPGQRWREVVDGIAVRRYPCPAGTGFVGLFLETLAALLGCSYWLLRLRLRGRIDVLHAFNPPDTLALLVWLLPGTRLVYDQADPVPELMRARGGAPAPLTWVMGWLEARALGSASLVLAVNNSCRALVLGRSSLSPSQVVVIRIGPSGVAPTVSVGAAPVVTFAGVMGVQDGVEVLLRAARLLLDRRPGLCTFDLVGDGPDVPRLQGLVTSLDLTSSVTWTGWLTGPDFTARLAAATVCVSPDADTEFNRIATMVKITDYLAAGRSCVVADLPETRVTCGDAVRYFPPGSAEGLSVALEEVLDAPGDLAHRALARAPALLWEHSAHRLVAAYAALVSGGPPVAPEHTP